MGDPSICTSKAHLFLPVIEVHDPLFRCVRCNVFADLESVKRLAKKASNGPQAPVPVSAATSSFAEDV